MADRCRVITIRTDEETFFAVGVLAAAYGYSVNSFMLSLIDQRLGSPAALALIKKAREVRDG